MPFPFRRCTAAACAWVYLSAPTTTPTDLVILDLNLPKLNGFQLLERIATLSLRPEAIVLTGSTRSEEDHVRALALGARQFYQKPYSWKWQRIAKDICAICDELRHKLPAPLIIAFDWGRKFLV